MTTCPLNGKDCDHCSDEQKVIIQHVGVIKTGAMERRETKIKMGEFCNNDGRHYVREMTECPSNTALAVPLVQHEATELEWMARRIS